MQLAVAVVRSFSNLKKWQSGEVHVEGVMQGGGRGLLSSHFPEVTNKVFHTEEKKAQLKVCKN